MSESCGPEDRSLRASTWLVYLAITLAGTSLATAEALTGVVLGASGEPIVGAMVTLRRSGERPRGNLRETTVFSNDAGQFTFVGISVQEKLDLRVRRIGWRELIVEKQWPAEQKLQLVVHRETNAEAVAQQLSADRWFALLYRQVSDQRLQENLVRTCLQCHQQGSLLTRNPRDEASWGAVLDRMETLGAILRPELRERLPRLLVAAYDPRTAVPALTSNMTGSDFSPPVSAEVRRAVIDEWQLGVGQSMQHDIMVHPNGRVYSVDLTQDILYSIDPESPGGDRKQYRIPHPEGFRIGGVVAKPGDPLPPGFNAYLAPHSLQVDSGGKIWITLSYGNRLASFDPLTEEWQDFPLSDDVLYPHTLRIDQQNRIWYTLMLSNHIGMFNIDSGEQRFFAIPPHKPNPIPYGIDIHPLDGSIWFSQLDGDHIGRLDPDTGEFQMIETPFPAPRRLRFDSKGNLWIPAFSGDKIVRYEPATGTFENFPLPTRSPGTDAAYSLTVNKKNDDIWISTTNSDTFVRLRYAAAPGRRFTVFPLPSRVTFTREIDFDARGRIYSSNSNFPLQHVEGGLATIIRLDPGD